MATATRKAARQANKRTKSLFERARHAAARARKIAIEAEVKSNPKFKELTKTLIGLRRELHMGRLRISRKDFAIQVREEKIADIPKQIAAIKKERSQQVAEVQVMEQREAAAKEEVARLREQTEQRLEKEGQIQPLFAA
jgi:DNA-directed RNA polymerase subunit K/omega